jgi:hypothetical protein
MENFLAYMVYKRSCQRDHFEPVCYRTWLLYHLPLRNQLREEDDDDQVG